MSYVINFVRSRFSKIFLKTTIVFLVLRGLVDMVLWFVTKSPVPIWEYGWIVIFILVLSTEILLEWEEIEGVKKYYREELMSRVEDKRLKAIVKYSNSTEKDLLFTIADELHQKQSLRLINKFIKEKSSGFYSLALKKRKESENFDLVLFKHYQNGVVTAKIIRYTKNITELKGIAENKINTDLDKYLEDGVSGRKLLSSVLFALTWISLDNINHQLKHCIWVSHPDRTIQVNTCYRSEDLGELLELQLFDCGKKIACLEIFKKGFVSD